PSATQKRCLMSVSLSSLMAELIDHSPMGAGGSSRIPQRGLPASRFALASGYASAKQQVVTLFPRAHSALHAAAHSGAATHAEAAACCRAGAAAEVRIQLFLESHQIVRGCRFLPEEEDDELIAWRLILVGRALLVGVLRIGPGCSTFQRGAFAWGSA